MTNKELIAKIRAEIERRIIFYTNKIQEFENYEFTRDANACKNKVSELNYLLSYLDKLK